MTDTQLRDAFAKLRTEVGKAVVGQDAAVTGLTIALLAGGHVLLEGVPGVAKTLLVRTLSHTLKLDTKRVQFTPDLMPGDLTGSLVYDSKAGEFEFREGPVFTTPAFMAERWEDILRWEREGYAGVEMEAATTLAVAQHFGVPCACLAYLLDNLIEEHDILDVTESQRQTIHGRRNLLSDVALEVVTEG